MISKSCIIFRCSASALVNHSVAVQSPPPSPNSAATLFAVGYFSRIIHLRPDVLIGHLLHERFQWRRTTLPYYYYRRRRRYSSQVVKVGFRINTTRESHAYTAAGVFICIMRVLRYNTRHWSKRVGRVAVPQPPWRGVRSWRGGTEHTRGAVGRGSCWFFGTVNLTSVCRRDRSQWWTWSIGHVELLRWGIRKSCGGGADLAAVSKDDHFSLHPIARKQPSSRDWLVITDLTKHIVTPRPNRGNTIPSWCTTCT